MQNKPVIPDNLLFLSEGDERLGVDARRAEPEIVDECSQAYRPRGILSLREFNRTSENIYFKWSRIVM